MACSLEPTGGNHAEPLNRETLSHLDGALPGIHGGIPTYTHGDDTCFTCTPSGCFPTCRDWPCDTDYCYSANIWNC
jgi:hypothetical protein